MKILGLTGGIGSGKSMASKGFQSLGVAVYDSDAHAKYCMNADLLLKSKIKSAFGEEAYTNGSLNRTFLAETIFKGPSKRKKLNALVHPAVQEHFRNWVFNQHGQYVVKEAAILFESGAYTQCDWVLQIKAPTEVRIQRCIENRGMTREEVLARMQSQWNDEQRSNKSDFEIENIGDLAALEKAIHQLHVKILAKI